MDRRSVVNNFHSFMGTLFFALFALVLTSAHSGGDDPAVLGIKVLLSAVLLVLSFYVLESGRRAEAPARPAVRPVVVEPLISLRLRRGSRVA